KTESLAEKVQDIHTSMDGINGRSSAILNNTKTMKTTQEALASDLQAAIAEGKQKTESLAEKVQNIHNSMDGINGRSSTILNNTNTMKTMQETLASDMETAINKIVSYGECCAEVQITSTNTSRMIKEVKENMEVLKVLVEYINVTTISKQNRTQDIGNLKDPIDELKTLENESNVILKDIQQSMGVCKAHQNTITHQSNIIYEKIEEMDRNILESEGVLMNTMIMTSKEIEGCPDGIFFSTQCFKIVRNRQTNSEDAEQVCHSEGLFLAEVHNTVSVPLTRFLLQRYGEGSYWINAKGEAGTFMWQRSNKAVNSNSIQLSLGHSDEVVTPNLCLSLVVSEEGWRNNSSQPYHPHDCSETEHYILCERLLEDSVTLKAPLLLFRESITQKLN
ncbi:unnamed protein product, partial [Meganyctiphanes norvegica]